MKRKLSITILSVCLIISFFTTFKYFFNVKDFYKKTDASIYSAAQEITKNGGIKLQEHFNQIKQTLRAASEKIDISDNTKTFEILKKDIESSKNLSAIGFAEIAKNKKVTKAFIINKKNTGEFIELNANSNEYSWFYAGAEQDEYISKPYFDKKIRALVVASSVIKQNNQKTSDNSKIILFALISNNDMNEIIQNLDFGSRGYGFITDYNGSIFLHPRKTFQFRNFIDIIKDKYTAENLRKVESVYSQKTSTVIDEKDFNSFSRKIIVLEPIADIQFFIGAILNKVELGFPFLNAKLLLLKLSLSAGLLVFFACMLIVSLKFNSNSMPKIFKYCSFVSSIAFIVIIGYVWYLQRFYGLPAPEADKGYVSDKASLIKFIDEEKKIIEINKMEEYSYISAGILVQSIKILGVNEAQVSGVIWQKIPQEFIGKITEGINFPEASTIRTEEIYRVTDDYKNLIVGWSFTTILRQQFDNKLYPFEQLDLKIQMRQKNVLDRIQLIPDLKSYDEYSSFSNSFVSKDLTIPEWLAKQTYFTIKKNEYMTTFGHFNSDIKSNIRDLTLNITLQRDFLANFFSTFLPFIVLLLLAFIGLLFSSGIEEKSKI